jgi:hypothetical protein
LIDKSETLLRIGPPALAKPISGSQSPAFFLARVFFSLEEEILCTGFWKLSENSFSYKVWQLFQLIELRLRLNVLEAIIRNKYYGTDHCEKLEIMG